MITAIAVPADMGEPIRQQHIQPSDVDAYRQLVGGPLEVVRLFQPDASLYIHEEGKLENLPPNGRVTALLWAHNSAFRGRDLILGDAFIVGPVDRNGDDTTAPEELVKLLFHTKRFRVLVRVAGDQRFYGNLIEYEDWLSAYLKAVDAAQRWRQVQEVRVVAAM